MNEAMKSMLGRARPADFANAVRLNQDLEQLLREGFTELNGTIVFTAMRNTTENVKLENFPDKTGFECFVNHIFVEDQHEGSVRDRPGHLKQAIAFALATDNQLRSVFPARSFKVIVAANAVSCGVRFHIERPGEEWLASDLDGYGQEAILVLETALVPTK